MATQCPFFHEEWTGFPGYMQGIDGRPDGTQVIIRQWCSREESPWPKARLGAAEPLICCGDLENCPLH